MAEFFHASGRTDMKRLIVTFRNFLKMYLQTALIYYA